MSGSYVSVFTFDVKGSTFTGTLGAKDTPSRVVRFTDGKIDGMQMSFSTTEWEKGWDKPQVVSRFFGRLDGNQLRLIYRSTEKRRAGLPPKKGGNVHLMVATRVTG